MIASGLVLVVCLLVQLNSHFGQVYGSNSDDFKGVVQNLRVIMDSRQIGSIGKLREAVSDANGGFNIYSPSQNLPREAIEKGIGDLVKSYASNIENNKKGKAKFDEAFQKLVLNPCDSVLREMRPIKVAYTFLLRNQNKARELDLNSLEWLVNTRICFDIFASKSEIEKGALEVSMGGNYQRSINALLADLVQGEAAISRALNRVRQERLLLKRSLGKGELSHS